MSQFNLATSYRPHLFAQVAGQAHVKAVLRAVAQSEKPAQQILLAGPSGTGKTTLARLLAGALFCSSRGSDGEPCGACESCKLVFDGRGAHPDVIEVDAASYGGVDQIRELATTATHSPLLAPWRVFIIDEAHGLTSSGGQAFLKLLEEPPSQAVFVLATTDPQKLPLAIRGRCLQLEVLPPTNDQLIENLKRVCAGQGWDIDDEVAEAVISASEPELGVRGTLMTLARLSPALASGTPVGEEQLRDTLAVAHPARIRELVESCLSGNLEAVVARATGLLAFTPSATLKSQLVGYTVEQLSQWDEAHCLAGVKLLTNLEESGRSSAGLLVALAATASRNLTEGAAVREIQPPPIQQEAATVPVPARTSSLPEQVPPVEELPVADAAAPQEEEGLPVEEELARPPKDLLEAPESPLSEDAQVVDKEEGKESPPQTSEPLVAAGPPTDAAHPFDLPAWPPPGRRSSGLERATHKAPSAADAGTDLLNQVASLDSRAAVFLRRCRIIQDGSDVRVDVRELDTEQQQHLREVLHRINEKITVQTS